MPIKLYVGNSSYISMLNVVSALDLNIKLSQISAKFNYKVGRVDELKLILAARGYLVTLVSYKTNILK